MTFYYALLTLELHDTSRDERDDFYEEMEGNSWVEQEDNKAALTKRFNAQNLDDVKIKAADELKSFLRASSVPSYDVAIQVGDTEPTFIHKRGNYRDLMKKMIHNGLS